MAKRAFWNWIKNESGRSRVLRLDGVIAEDPWFDDEVSPKEFRDELFSGDGDVTVWINSPGGDVTAGAQIYNMLREYSGRVTVKIDGLAASAASVIAMAGDEILMSPVSMMMIHNPSTLAVGDSEEMLRAKSRLDEVKESIINAYQRKTGKPRGWISGLMDDETWMSADKAVELGFADGVTDAQGDGVAARVGVIFNRAVVANSILNEFCLNRAKLPLAGRPRVSAEVQGSLLESANFRSEREAIIERNKKYRKEVLNG
jgi:ATP-dependent Clp protease protease subunit